MGSPGSSPGLSAKKDIRNDIVIEDGAYICYRIVDTNGKFFPINFEFRENAEKICSYLSNRDNEKYIIKKFYYEIGIPEYHDYFVNEIP